MIHDALIVLSALCTSLVAALTGLYLVKDHISSSALKQIRTLVLITLSTIFFSWYFSTTSFCFSICSFLLLLWSFALTITAHTDAHTLLISPWCTLYLIPLGLISAWQQWLPLTVFESILGIIFGGGVLLITATLGRWYYKTEALGQGDIELLAMCGAFLGPISCFRILLYGSTIGSLWGTFCILLHKGSSDTLKLPFGTFLALAGLVELWLLCTAAGYSL